MQFATLKFIYALLPLGQIAVRPLCGSKSGLATDRNGSTAPADL